ncbi:capsular polysaccharide biosynthesis protein [Primorskyibacter sedentarius]|uniref:Capsular polysaccharide biosynthesis protein n=2 Tax=Primorskyibacter sedentarius TaxID=745311 RepID=A0A4R3JM26_9RHOB|nr:capsular polysaccharide biosynthesis protein [Primorskyibacter sedentarius]
MHINVHLPWWVRNLPEQSRFLEGQRFFNHLVDALMKDPDIVLTVSKKPVRAQFYGPETYCLNHHRSFTRKRNLNVKDAYLRGFFYVDQKGYSGWSEIASRTFDPAAIDGDAARAYFLNKLWKPFLQPGKSKYPQPDTTPKLPEEFVLVPLQVPGDQVLKLAFFSQERLLKTLIDQPKLPVVIKLHPVAQKDHPDYCETIKGLHDPDKGVFVVDGHLHRMIEAARAVVCTNSGAGLEAILLNRPVITCGKTDYHHLADVVRNPSDLWPTIMKATPPAEDIMHRYAKWFFGEMLIDTHQSPEIWVAEVMRRIRASGN